MPNRNSQVEMQQSFLLKQSPLMTRELRARMDQLGIDILMRQRIDPLLTAELLEDIAVELRRRA